MNPWPRVYKTRRSNQRRALSLDAVVISYYIVYLLRYNLALAKVQGYCRKLRDSHITRLCTTYVDMIYAVRHGVNFVAITQSRMQDLNPRPARAPTGN